MFGDKPFRQPDIWLAYIFALPLVRAIMRDPNLLHALSAVAMSNEKTMGKAK